MQAPVSLGLHKPSAPVTIATPPPREGRLQRETSRVGQLIAIEGADGVGKATTAGMLCETLNAMGHSAVVISFPRYGDTVGGVTIGRFLAGDMPVPVTPKAAAVLYALDRLESRDHILKAQAAHDVVIFDRYVASNMAYQGAKLDGDAGDLLAWIAALETGQFALPAPDLNIYLDTPWDLARALILQKAQRSYTDRSFDEHESDAALQLRVREMYGQIAAAGLLGTWKTVQASADGEMRASATIVAEIINHIGLDAR